MAKKIISFKKKMMDKELFLIVCLTGVMIAGRSQSYSPEKNNPKIKVKPAADIKAYAFNLKDVRLLGGSPFKNAEDRDAGFLLSIDAGRLLHRFYLNAGLPTNGDVYGGWESAGLGGSKLEVPSQTVHALGVSHASTGRATTLTNSFEIQNLTDAKVFDFYGAQRPGRSFHWKISLEYQ